MPDNAARRRCPPALPHAARRPAAAPAFVDFAPRTRYRRRREHARRTRLMPAHATAAPVPPNSGIPHTHSLRRNLFSSSRRFNRGQIAA